MGPGMVIGAVASEFLPRKKEPRGLRRSSHQEQKHKHPSCEQVCRASWCPRLVVVPVRLIAVEFIRSIQCFECSTPSPYPAHRTWGGSLQHVKRILGPGCLLYLCHLCLKRKRERVFAGKVKNWLWIC